MARSEQRDEPLKENVATASLSFEETWKCPRESGSVCQSPALIWKKPASELLTATRVDEGMDAAA